MRRDYIDFQDRSAPLAFMITIRCYGTWLHGDERGSMDRLEFNKFAGPKIPPNQSQVHFNQRLLLSSAIMLDAAQRNAVHDAIVEFAQFKKLSLYSLNVRTNHAHVVINAGSSRPEPLMGSIKSYATRKLRARKLVPASAKIWARHGSTRYLWTEEHISHACDYVVNGQGDELPMFD